MVLVPIGLPLDHQLRRNDTTGKSGAYKMISLFRYAQDAIP